MTGDEYVTVLLERQQQHCAKRGITGPYRPLLEWFIRPGDEDMVDLPVEPAALKLAPTPRRYRSAASLRAERDRLVARRGRLGRPDTDDPAAVRAGHRQVTRQAARLDRELRRYVTLDGRISYLNHRLDLALARGDLS